MSTTLRHFFVFNLVKFRLRNEVKRAFAQRPDQVEMMVRALKKEGIAEEVIAETIAGLATIFKPRTHFSEYNYKSVLVNQVIEDSIFIPST